jgi:hypothetical protein
VLAPGPYDFDTPSCYVDDGHRERALCIGRSISIEAEVNGTAVLDARGINSPDGRGTIYIDTSEDDDEVQLIGLNITGGFTIGVDVSACPPCSSNQPNSVHSPQLSHARALFHTRAVSALSSRTRAPFFTHTRAVSALSSRTRAPFLTHARGLTTTMRYTLARIADGWGWCTNNERNSEHRRLQHMWQHGQRTQCKACQPHAAPLLLAPRAPQTANLDRMLDACLLSLLLAVFIAVQRGWCTHSRWHRGHRQIPCLRQHRRGKRIAWRIACFSLPLVTARTITCAHTPLAPPSFTRLSLVTQTRARSFSACPPRRRKMGVAYS